MTSPARSDRGLLLVKSGGAAALPEWQAHFAAFAPGLQVRYWDDPNVDPDAVTYALVWEPEPGRLARYRALRVIFSSAAGVDHITRDPDLPRGVPIVRMKSTETAQTVGEYVCLAALSILRDTKRLAAAQAARRWDTFEAPRTALDTRVGVMGLGNVGQVAVRMLAALGFHLSGWARTRRELPGVEVHAGSEELARFLSGCDILVALLPETPLTRGLIDRDRIRRLPRGAGIVNAGRGSLIVMPDLIAALDEGHISAAVLDVFDPEPLPPDHPAWRHPGITVTSHVAGFASRRSRAQAVAAALAAYEAGSPLPSLYQADRGY
ncbi:MAG TPA: glyoxylate/hydroxypyruvate reductase A [Xanthobacteraceae bacterium]|nr:glyoxylate/hydroxypyruvate reductase A [Xanthobacteraceae bacterium]